ncbi:ATPase, F1 complex, delta/epsilon subunit [Artemisia annua]|uniref:ATP synthase subunit delta', mitochondrial n=1 Tax=Artemisia annua TaxID=35608 RepID=A0A2U1Q600_ARTAN|nr:ATPase, F1 complex, delta/epsilon subunit [Artemisia annua]
MFRHAANRLLTRSTTTTATIRRAFSTEVSSTDAGDSAFNEAWKKVVPNIDPPKTPSQYMETRPPTPNTLPSKLTVNFVLPYSSELSKQEVDMVIVPATTGQMGILPGHVPTIAELKPGLLSVHEGNDVKKYFISSGFAFVHSNSYADILAVEAIPLDRIDPAQVQKGLSEFTQKLSSASSDLDKAEAQIGVDVHSALNSALTG